jgi:hypothetical protein
MDEETRQVVQILMRPFEFSKDIVQSIKGTPYSETVTVTTTFKPTMKAIKLEIANKVWINGDPECEKKP